MSQSRPLAIVTGGRRGIGAGIAIDLAARGFDLALTDIDASGAEATLAEINKAQPSVSGRLVIRVSLLMGFLERLLP